MRRANRRRPITSTITEALWAWINTRLSTPRPEFSGLPACPYARTAFQTGAVRINDRQEADVARAVLSTIRDFGQGGYEVVIDVFGPPEDVELQTLKQTIEAIEHTAKSAGLVCLIDHPDLGCVVEGVETSFGERVLVMTQRIAPLEAAARALKVRRYYDRWDQASFAEIVGRRGSLAA